MTIRKRDSNRHIEIRDYLYGITGNLEEITIINLSFITDNTCNDRLW